MVHSPAAIWKAAAARGCKGAKRGGSASARRPPARGGQGRSPQAHPRCLSASRSGHVKSCTPTFKTFTLPSYVFFFLRLSPSHFSEPLPNGLHLSRSISPKVLSALNRTAGLLHSYVAFLPSPPTFLLLISMNFSIMLMFFKKHDIPHLWSAVIHYISLLRTATCSQLFCFSYSLFLLQSTTLYLSQLSSITS